MGRLLLQGWKRPMWVHDASPVAEILGSPVTKWNSRAFSRFFGEYTTRPLSVHDRRRSTTATWTFPPIFKVEPNRLMILSVAPPRMRLMPAMDAFLSRAASVISCTSNTGRGPGVPALEPGVELKVLGEEAGRLPAG